MSNTSRRTQAAVLVLGVSTFSYVTIEVLPIGLLTVIAEGLDRSRSDIGLLVTGYAVVVVLAAIPLARLTLGLPRRPVLSATLGLMAVGAAASALAPTYDVLLVARLLTALSHALFWSIIFPITTGLFPPAARGWVVAKLSIGSALAPVIGIPLGTWLGEQAGWRVPFALMAVLGAATCLGVASLLPRVGPREALAGRGSTPDVRRYVVLVVSTAVGVAGFLTFNTYVTPFLLDISGVTSRRTEQDSAGGSRQHGPRVSRHQLRVQRGDRGRCVHRWWAAGQHRRAECGARRRPAGVCSSHRDDSRRAGAGSRSTEGGRVRA